MFYTTLQRIDIGRKVFTHQIPTDNGAMEAINGWAKTEMFVDFHINECDDVPTFIEKYIQFFNEERPACTLGYLTPVAYRMLHEKKQKVSTNR